MYFYSVVLEYATQHWHDRHANGSINPGKITGAFRPSFQRHLKSEYKAFFEFLRTVLVLFFSYQLPPFFFAKESIVTRTRNGAKY